MNHAQFQIAVLDTIGKAGENSTTRPGTIFWLLPTTYGELRIDLRPDSDGLLLRFQDDGPFPDGANPDTGVWDIVPPRRMQPEPPQQAVDRDTDSDLREWSVRELARRLAIAGYVPPAAVLSGESVVEEVPPGLAALRKRMRESGDTPHVTVTDSALGTFSGSPEEVRSAHREAIETYATKYGRKLGDAFAEADQTTNVWPTAEGVATFTKQLAEELKAGLAPVWKFLGCTTGPKGVESVTAAAMVSGNPVIVQWDLNDDGTWSPGAWDTRLNFKTTWVPEGVPMAPPAALLEHPADGWNAEPVAWMWEMKMWVGQEGSWRPWIAHTPPEKPDSENVRNVTPLFRLGDRNAGLTADDSDLVGLVDARLEALGNDGSEPGKRPEEHLKRYHRLRKARYELSGDTERFEAYAKEVWEKFKEQFPERRVSTTSLFESFRKQGISEGIWDGLYEEFATYDHVALDDDTEFILDTSVDDEGPGPFDLPDTCCPECSHDCYGEKPDRHCLECGWVENPRKLDD